MFRSFVFVAAALLALVPTTSCAFVDKVVEKSLDASTSTGNGNLRNTLGRETGNRQLQLLELEGFGGSPDAKHLPFNECQGDCDDDSECVGDLICFQRGPGEEVPGCAGGKEVMSKTDYCIQPEVLTATKRSNGGGSSATFSFSIGEPEEGDQEEEEEEGEPEASAASRVFHIEAFVGFAPVLLTISTIYFC